jgi:hypothetical protein
MNTQPYDYALLVVTSWRVTDGHSPLDLPIHTFNKIVANLQRDITIIQSKKSIRFSLNSALDNFFYENMVTISVLSVQSSAVNSLLRIEISHMIS